MHGEFDWGSMLVMLVLLGSLFVVPAVVFYRDHRRAEGSSRAVVGTAEGVEHAAVDVVGAGRHADARMSRRRQSERRMT